MSERLKDIKERSKLRRQLLAQQLGAADASSIGQLLGCKDEVKSKGESSDSSEKSIVTITSSPKYISSSYTTSVELPGIPAEKPPKVLVLESQTPSPSSKPVEKTEGKESSDSECEFDESVYQDSSAFLKGTQSANPHNDYCQNFLDTGQRPQNYIRDTDYAERFEEYPKLKELIRLKDEIISKRATPPMYLKADLETFDLRELNCKFDVILLDPPLEEYQRRAIGTSFNWRPWTWDEIMRLEIEEIAAQRSFIFMWCGSHEGLYLGRKCLKKWGFRRCEDICWIKTNKNNPGPTKYLEPDAIFQHTKEHCLMGIKGTVRRSTDGDFIHANVDIDLIITEEAPYGSTEKPIEMFHIIEHFCLGRRRLNLFGSDSTLRPGWLTVGPDLSSSNYNSETYNAYFSNGPDDYLVGNTPEIETLRPKSPVGKNKDGGNRGRGGSGRGRGGQGQSNRGGMNKVMRGGMSGRGMSRGGGGFPGRGMHRGGFQQS